MKPYLLIFVFLILFSRSYFSSAQFNVTTGTALGFNPQQLIQNWLIGQNITISNVTYNGSDTTISDDQIGIFSALDSAKWELGLDSGIIMTCGNAGFAKGPNNFCSKGEDTGGPGDGDLDLLTGVTRSTHDRAVIEFDFYPSYDTLKFNYVFSSEEFYNFCNTQYNDCFGFFLSGPGITGPFSNNAVNIAFMPGKHFYVTINNLCDDTTSNWCNSPLTCIRTNPNPPCLSCVLCDNPRGHGMYIQYNGLTYVFTAWYIVQPCQLYHIKLAIADAGDHILDSGVFLEKNSFSSSGLQLFNTFSIPSLNQGAIEGCNDAIVSFKLLSPAVNSYAIHITIGGTAVNGIDYTAIPDSVVVPAGYDSTGLIIHPVMDGITEGTETVTFIAQMPGCTQMINYYDTIKIFDNSQLFVFAGNDTSICTGTSLMLQAISGGGQQPFQYIWNTGSTLQNINISPPLGTNSYWISVSDICTNSVTDTITVNVTPNPAVTNTQHDYSMCSGTFTNIILQSNVSGATFTWYASTNSPNITGYSGGTGTIINQNLINTGSTHDTVEYDVYATANGCDGPIQKFKVVVVPIPDIYFQPAGENICSGQTTGINILSGFPLATFTWTYTVSSPNVSGASDGTGNLISQTLLNNGIVTDSVVYHVQASAGGCTGNIYNVTVEIRPLPDITNTNLTDTLCNNTTTNIILGSTINPATYSWTVTCSSPFITGFSAGNLPAIIQTLNNSGQSIDSVIYHVQPSSGGCDGPVTDFSVFVCPVAGVIFIPPSQILCSGTGTTISLGSAVTGALFSWTASASLPGISGYFPGSGNQITQILYNSDFIGGTVTYQVFPEIFGCPGHADQIQVTVNPLPHVSFIPCIDTITTTNAKPFLLKGGIPLGGTYSGPGVNPATGIFNPAAAGAGNKTITYTYTNVALCSASATIHIFNFQFSIFNCGNSLTDIRDNQTYQTVQIGSQCWLTENLRYGTEIPDNIVQRDNCVAERYSNPASSIQHPASVYQWDELMQYTDTPGHQGLCPPAWHVPTEAEWQTLFSFYNGPGFAAGPLLSSGFSGFNALVNGSRFENSSWNFTDFAVHFWTSSAWGPLKAWAHAMNNVPDDHSVSTYPSSRSNAFSVRCVKD